VSTYFLEASTSVNKYNISFYTEEDIDSIVRKQMEQLTPVDLNYDFPEHAMETPALDNENCMIVIDDSNRGSYRCGACLRDDKDVYYRKAGDLYPWLCVGFQDIDVPPEAAICLECVDVSKNTVRCAVLDDITHDRRTLLRQVITGTVYTVLMKRKRSGKIDKDKLFAVLSRHLLLFHYCKIDYLGSLFPDVSERHLIDFYLTMYPMWQTQ
jgi:hypothetical protein